MKKILITGGAGNLGIEILKQLLKINKYEITALDLKSIKSSKRLKPFSKKINIIYGDINDDFLINALIKEQDIVIHLAAVLPPLANYKVELTSMINVDGLVNVVNAINNNGNKTFLLYASSICVYEHKDNNSKININTNLTNDIDNYYASSKISAEKVIEKYLKNYSIFRFCPIMGSKNIDSMMYDIPLNSNLEIITLKNAATAIINSLDFQKDINTKIFNVGGGKKCQTTYKEFLREYLSIRGISYSIIRSFLIEDRNYYCGYYSDTSKLNKIINYQTDDLEEYYRRLKKSNGKKRIINRLLGYPFKFFIKVFNEKK